MVYVVISFSLLFTVLPVDNLFCFFFFFFQAEDGIRDTSVTGVQTCALPISVIGGPDPDMGERVIAIVQPIDMADASEALSAELEAFAREKLSGVKIPRQIDFLEELPRAQTEIGRASCRERV